MFRILLVDDEPNVLGALQRVLRNKYQVEAFTSPLDALIRCKEALFDLVIADYQMPQLSGIEFLKKLGTIQPDAARMVLSGHADIGMLDRAINETHIYRFVAKPWEEAELSAAISQALEYRRIFLENRALAAVHRKAREGLGEAAKKGQYRILLVDGDEMSLQLMWNGLTQPSYKGLYGAMQQEMYSEKTVVSRDVKLVVDASPSMAQSLQNARFTAYDLVIAAHNIPETNGIAFLRELRKTLPDAAFILVSDNPDEKTLAEAINDLHVHSFLNISWKTHELKADAMRRSWDIYQLKSAVMQALIARELMLDSRALAGGKAA